MSKFWIGFVATWGVVVGTVFACQLAAAEEPAAGGGDAGVARGSRASAARSTPVPASPNEPLTVLKSGPEHVRVVYCLKSAPAVMVNQELQQLFRLEGGLHKSAAATAKGTAGANVVIVPCAISNSLVISGPPDAVEEVRTLLDKLDQTPGMVLLEVEIGMAPVGETKHAETPKPQGKSAVATAEPFRLLERPAKMETTDRVRLITLNNQMAYVQMGSRVPRVTGVSGSSTSGGTRSMSIQDVGLIVSVTPRIGSDGAVTMQIDAEQSQPRPENEGVPIAGTGDKVVREPQVDATIVQTTVRIPNAQTVILGSTMRQSKSDKELVVIVTPHIIGLEEAKKTR